jgi:hypothetical protein
MKADPSSHAVLRHRLAHHSATVVVMAVMITGLSGCGDPDDGGGGGGYIAPPASAGAGTGR